MSGIMRAPSPDYLITIPLNGRTLQNYDFVVLTGLGLSTLFVYKNGDWAEVGETSSSISVNDGNIIIRVGHDPGNGFYACFIPGPVST